MNWHRHNDEAEADGGDTFSHYQIKHPFGICEYYEASQNGNRLAKVDTIEEGINLCEWVERTGNA